METKYGLSGLLESNLDVGKWPANIFKQRTIFSIQALLLFSLIGKK